MMSSAVSSQPSAEDFSSVLAQFANELTVADLPPAAVAVVKADVFDTLVCAAAGSSAPAIPEIRELAAEWGGAPQATVFVYGDKIPAHQAAWVNGAMAHARDYDDAHDAATLHAGVSVVPGALAAAELAGGVSGADFIAAVAVGLETISRLGMCTKLSIVDSGYMYTSLFGYFAATIAAARALKLDKAQTVNALGISYSQVAGNHQVTRDAALTKRMQPGYAAMSGVMSVQLARRGIRGVQSTFDGEDGFLRVYLHNKFDRPALTEGLGKRWDFTQLGFKLYPCCRLTHGALEAALALRAKVGNVGRIKRIRVGVNHMAYEAVCTPVEVRKAPKTIVTAQFSIPYTVAAALVDGAVGLAHFTDPSLQRPDILAVAQKVESYVHEEIERVAGRSVSPTQVDIEMEDGTTHSLRVDLPSGHPDLPMSAEVCEAKARGCFRIAVRPFGDSAARDLRSLCDGLESLDDVRKLVRVMNAGP